MIGDYGVGIPGGPPAGAVAGWAPAAGPRVSPESAIIARESNLSILISLRSAEGPRKLRKSTHGGRLCWHRRGAMVTMVRRVLDWWSGALIMPPTVNVVHNVAIFYGLITYTSIFNSQEKSYNIE